ncbi:XRE family transcriptional regulator [Acinetobacter baumannii]|uniref:helix-turn-helix domain-containing protein n=2 Tax=Acinetobacter baumannii TaxID=470 RepID=UPI000C18A9F4|nr:helix-turn-helix domain-containing protein [Acinetobacter baumannii]ATR89606.1 DNA-binding protein [Acinetobacter baumannii]EHU1798096.1 helix-turn-helix transcriptional regulator [Acinetobacter baumannii]EHU2486407.1 helix-turn-helix transcriptional regulator [Acinetobacter baumannii]EHU2885005.1 helix-turn-helix transcriptional regulator [Acinetobacter baumannii]EKV5729694.1 helix-turn-helix transcriptional regulator [Acinetobacter baumannii]
MAKLNDIISKRSPESQQRIKKMANQMLLDIKLSNLREELKISQAEIAKNLGVSQAAISKREKLGKDLKISSLKEYVEAMGGKVRLDVELPNGKHVAISI